MVKATNRRYLLLRVYLLRKKYNKSPGDILSYFEIGPKSLRKVNSRIRNVERTLKHDFGDPPTNGTTLTLPADKTGPDPYQTLVESLDGKTSREVVTVLLETVRTLYEEREQGGGEDSQALEDLREENEELDEHIRELETILAQQRQLVRQQEEQMVHLGQKVASLTHESVALQNDLETADEEIEECVGERGVLSQTNAILEGLVKEKETLLKVRTQQLEQFAQDYEELRRRFIQLSKEVGRKEVEATSDLPQHTDRLRAEELQEQLKELEKLRKELEDKEEEIDELINRIETQEIKIEEMEDEIEQEKRTRARFERAYNKLKADSSNQEA